MPNFIAYVLGRGDVNGIRALHETTKSAGVWGNKMKPVEE